MKRLFLKVESTKGHHIIAVDQISRVSPKEIKDSDVLSKITLLDGETVLYSNESQEDIYYRLTNL